MTQKAERGGTIVEFIIVFPLLVIFLSGLLMSGILLSQISWSMQSSFETALLGRASSQGVGEAKMRSRFEVLTALMGGQLVDVEDNTFIPRYVSEGVSEFVKVDLNARVRALGLGSAYFPLNMTVYAHYNQIENSLAGFSDFENPSCHYVLSGSCAPEAGTVPVPVPEHGGLDTGTVDLRDTPPLQHSFD
jgi:hypothetical protein